MDIQPAYDGHGYFPRHLRGSSVRGGSRMTARRPASSRPTRVVAQAPLQGKRASGLRAVAQIRMDSGYDSAIETGRGGMARWRWMVKP